MAWPLSQDYNEAIQSPESSFADAELRLGQATTNALGLPLPRSGNFADVYEMICPSGKWAVKCFTREVKGLRERYAEISKFLAQSQLPFMVDFQFLDQGIRIKGQWYPLLKMRWVEGLLLNEFVRNHLDKPAILENLFKVWLRLSRWLRDAEMAHADLQHGNIILVPGSRAGALALKLIDYDGLFVPALAGRASGEFGHPSYQHPQRADKGYYGPEVDRLPLLGVACGLRALIWSGKALWDRYDTGDNILFREIDLKNPGESVLFKELWNLPDAAAHDLTGYLTMALGGELTQVPWVDQFAVQDKIQPLNQSQEEWVSSWIGPGAKIRRTTLRVEAPKPTPATTAPASPSSPISAQPVAVPNPGAAANPFAALQEESPPPSSLPRRRPKPTHGRALILAGIGAFVILIMATVVIVLTRGGSDPVEVAKGPPKPPVVHHDDSKKNGKDKEEIDTELAKNGKGKEFWNGGNTKGSNDKKGSDTKVVKIGKDKQSTKISKGDKAKEKWIMVEPSAPQGEPGETIPCTVKVDRTQLMGPLIITFTYNTDKIYSPPVDIAEDEDSAQIPIHIEKDAPLGQQRVGLLAKSPSSQIPKFMMLAVVRRSSKGNLPISAVVKLGSWQKGALTLDDPPGPVAKKPAKQYTFKLEKGKSYVMDLNAKSFDGFLQLTLGTKLMGRDPSRQQAGGNPHMWICPEITGDYTLWVTSANGNGAGDYSLMVKECDDQIPADLDRFLKTTVALECIIDKDGKGFLTAPNSKEFKLQIRTGNPVFFKWICDRRRNGYFYFDYAQRSPHYLTGDPKTGNLQLTPHDTIVDGTNWKIHDAGDELVRLECRGQGGQAWLQGFPAKNEVRLTSDRNAPGTTWRMVIADPKTASSKGVDDAGGKEVLLGKYKSATPKMWIMKGGRAINDEYQIKLPDPQEDDGEGLLQINKPKAATFTVEAAVKAWRGNFKVTPGKKLEDLGTVTPMKIGDFTLTILDLEGTLIGSKVNSPKKELPDYRMVAVYIEVEGGPYLIRLTGPAETIAHHKDDFDKWLRNFKK